MVPYFALIAPHDTFPSVWITWALTIAFSEFSSYEWKVVKSRHRKYQENKTLMTGKGGKL